MSLPILVTKLFIPARRPEIVSRSHLIEQLNQGLHNKLTLISAPAGFGKTTLVTDWLQSQGDDASSPFFVAWLSLDEGDNDLVRFLTYFVSALNRLPGLEPEIGVGALQMLQASQPPPPETILISVINELALATQKIVLILDDYHLIDARQVHESINFLIENLPPQLHLVITTREDPPIPISRLRSRSHLTELRAVDLRFKSTEAAEFLNQVMGLNLSAADIAALEARTEGWITGLQMAAISMQGSQDVEGFIESFTGSHRYVLDYLIEEVLEQQHEEIQTFLLQTAILDRLNGSLCNAVTGQENGQETLEMLDHTNLFIIPLDHERHWYRYHHLFGDLLLQRLRQTQSDQIPDLHIRAGEWFNQQGMKREAIKHSLAGRNYQEAADIIKSIAIDIIQQGDHTTVVRWIDAIPEEYVKEQPYLCIFHAWALQLSGQMEISASLLTNAENALDNLKTQDKEDLDTALGLLHSRRAYNFFIAGEHDKTVYYAKQALELLPENAALVRLQTALYLGIAYRYQGELHSALKVYKDVLPNTQAMGNKLVSVLYSFHLGDLYTEMAQLHQAKEVYEEAIKFSERHTGHSDMPFTGYSFVSIGRILRQWNQLDDAYNLITKGIGLCRKWNFADALALSCIELAYICQALGREEQARKSIKEGIQVMDSISSWGSQIAAAHQVKLDLAHGDVAAADRWVAANDLDTDSDYESHRDLEYLALTRVFIAQKRFDEALSLAEWLYRKTKEIGRRQNELESLILLALIFFMQEDTDQALVHLERALSIGEPEGYIRIFVDEGLPMARLLYEALSREIAPDYVRKLLAAFPETEPEKDLMNQPGVTDSEWIEPLSDRELEVLQLIAEGYSRQEVATRLVLSLNTVKTHARNIYSKMGVNSQMQAAVKARALGLLEKDKSS